MAPRRIEPRRLIIPLVGCLLTGTAGGTDAPCGPVRITEPAADAFLGLPRPTLRWTPAPGARAYRVRLLSRVPEGGTLVSLDVQTSPPDFTPPRPLAHALAVVRVTVTPRCGEGPALADGREAAPRFFLDTRLACGTPQALTAEPAAGGARLHWAAVQGARAYEVLTYATADGRLLERKEIREPTATVPAAGHTASVVAIRPRCADGYGAFAFASIP